MRRINLLLVVLSAVLAACSASIPLEDFDTMQDLDYSVGGPQQFTTIDGRRIAYKDYGQGPETLLFVHPWAGNIKIWDQVAPTFADRYRVVLLDIPGHGKSAKPRIDYDIELAAETVAALMDHLALDRVTLLGNSLGGGISLAVIREHPERVERLILIDALGGGAVPGLFAFFIDEFFVASMFSAVDDGLVETFTNMFVFDDTHAGTDTFIADLLASRHARDGYAWALSVSSYLRTAVNYDATPWLGDITAPTLIVWGDGDWVIWPAAAEHLHEHIPTSELVWMEDCGHMPEVERPEELVRHIRAFLDAHPAARVTAQKNGLPF